MTSAPVTRGRLRFTADYEEKVTLANGSLVTLRVLRPEDAPRLVEGFRELSPASRYMRFFGVKRSLLPAEVAYLTDVDGWNHCALGAAVQGPSGEKGVGVARFIRLRHAPDVAELAIAVVDRLQGKGLGRILLERLIQAARERQITRFRFEVLTANARMLNLVHDVIPDAKPTQDGTEIHFDVPLDRAPATEDDPAASPSTSPSLTSAVAGGLFKD